MAPSAPPAGAAGVVPAAPDDRVLRIYDVDDLLSRAAQWKSTQDSTLDRVAAEAAMSAELLRLATVVREKMYEMREEKWWNNPDESSRRVGQSIAAASLPFIK